MSSSTLIPVRKVILCGEFGVGKTSLFRRFSTNTFSETTDRLTTMGLDHFDKVFNIDQNSFKFQLWDTGGMERVATVTSSYYKFSEAAILVFAFDNPSSFHVLPQYLLDVITNAENAKIFLCANKIDLCNDQIFNISDSEIEMFCEQCHNVISGVYKISCKNNQGVEEMFNDIAKTLLNSNLQKLDMQTIDLQLQSNNQDDKSRNKCLCYRPN